MESNKHFLPIAVVVAGALVAGAIYFGGSSGSSSVSINKEEDMVAIAPVTSKDHIIGSPDAKVIIVEYSDTECPFCKVFHSTLRDTMDAYKGQSIAWVYRQFPIEQLHARAPKEAEATECTAEQGGNTAFWAYLDKIFATTQSNDTLDPAQLPILAGAIGLNVDAFTQCLTSGKYADKITKDVKAAFALGAQGTPYTVIISGKKKTVVIGMQELSTMKAVIDPLLK